MRNRMPLAVAVGLIGTLAVIASAGLVQDEGAYRGVLDRYLAGDAEAAVATLAGWDPAAVERAVAAAGDAGDVRPAAARALLHTEAGLHRGTFGAPREPGVLIDAVSGAEVHYRTASTLVDRLIQRLDVEPDDRLRTFCVGWFVVESSVGVHWSRRFRWRDAEALFADEPDIRLLGAAIREDWMGPYALDGPLGRTGDDLFFTGFTRGLEVSTSHGVFSATLAREAEGRLREVLAHRPDVSEARLRLGRVQFLLDRPSDARRELEAALAGARAGGDVFVGYLSALFLGALHERAGRLDEAEAHYRAAIATYPPGSSARAALAAILLGSGRQAEAATVVQPLFDAPAGRPDPWALYRSALFRQVPERLRALRALVGAGSPPSPAPPAAWSAVVERGVPGLPAPRPERPGVFRARADGVRLHVTVLDRGRAVPGLTAADFDVRDDGARQDVVAADATSRLATTFVVDTSTSVAGPPGDRLARAVAVLAGALGPDDPVSLVTFSDRIVRRPWRGTAGAAQPIPVDPHSKTVMWDAVVAAGAAASAEEGLPFVVVFGDGADNASWLDGPRVGAALSRAGVVVTTV